MKTKTTLNKIAAVLAFIIGAMSIFAGGQVFLGILPDYYVIDWLVVYNFVAGIASAFFAAIVIWKNSRLAFPSAITIFSLHAAVMVILQTAYSDVVAPDSIKAMTVRLVFYTIILTLLFIQQKKIKKQGDMA
ncbi:MAG: hypothetical protein FD146_2351 [Anaerolineaceae bacterium]|nr:MAG: hypothetical protein FD146_2351 [Anaerolineaceae bacterium]